VDQVTDDATVTEDFFSYGYALLARAALALFVDNDWTAARDATSEAEECFAQTQTGHWEIATARLYRCIALLYLGELGELSRSRRVYLRQAQNHGDRLSAVSLRTRFASPWLLGDDPLAGRQDVRDAIAMWPPERDGFTLPHWFAACSLAQFSLYEGVPDEAVEHLAQRADELDRGFVGGTPLLAAELAFLRGRIALAQAAVGGADRSAAIGAARRHARRLVRSSLPAPRAWGQLLEAAADIAADRPAATARLRSAIVALEQGDNHLYANAARYHLAHRIGGDEGGEIRVEVEAWMRAHPTYNVAAFANFLLPGCE
jgi:hypothetical protein